MPSSTAGRDARRYFSKLTDLLEPDGRVPGIVFEELEVLVREFTDGVRQLSVVRETRRQLQSMIGDDGIDTLISSGADVKAFGYSIAEPPQ